MNTSSWAETIRRTTGIVLDAARAERLSAWIERRRAKLSLAGAESWLESALRDERDPDRDELIRLVVNHESSFFRDPDQLDSVAAFLRERSAERKETLQVWSAGCSTGEEAYSLAMLTLRDGVDAHILGTDLSAEAIATARRGHFKSFSLRRELPDGVDRFFEIDDTSLRPTAAVIKRVRFAVHNLLEAPPAAASSGGGWDAVLLRNVVIYFDAAAAAELVARIATRLAPGGRLFLGSGELLAALSEKVAFEPIGDTIALRPARPDDRRPAAAAPRPAPVKKAPPPSAPPPPRILPAPEPPTAIAELERGLEARRAGDALAYRAALRRAADVDHGLWPAAFLLANELWRESDPEAIEWYRRCRDGIRSGEGRRNGATDWVLPELAELDAHRRDVKAICEHRLTAASAAPALPPRANRHPRHRSPAHHPRRGERT